MDAHPKFGELCHCGADIHHIAAEPIELGDHQHVTGFEAIKEAREPAPLRGSDISGYRLSDHTPGLDLEAGCRDLLQLVVRRLACGGHAKSDGVSAWPTALWMHQQANRACRVSQEHGIIER